MDASKLKLVQVAIPLDTIASLYPKLGKGLSTVLNNTIDLFINHLNTNLSNIECAFVNILIITSLLELLLTWARL